MAAALQHALLAVGLLGMRAAAFVPGVAVHPPHVHVPPAVAQGPAGLKIGSRALPPRRQTKVPVMQAADPNSKVKNANPDDFATYLAKRQAAAEGRAWTPAGGAPAASAPAYSAGGGVKEDSNSKIKNANPDDFATYLAKRQAAEQGRAWAPAGGAPAAGAPAYSAGSGVKEDSNSKIKNANPDDFAAYMAKRQAAEQAPAASGNTWAPAPAVSSWSATAATGATGGSSGAAKKWTPAPPGYVPRRYLREVEQAGVAQEEGAESSLSSV